MGTPIVRGPLKLQPSPGYSIDIDTRGFKTTVANLVGRNGKDCGTYDSCYPTSYLDQISSTGTISFSGLISV